MWNLYESTGLHTLQVPVAATKFQKEISNISVAMYRLVRCVMTAISER